MIGRHQMAPVIAVCWMPIGRGGRLLALGRHRRIPGKCRYTGQGALVTLGIIPEFHCAPPRTIEPESEAVVIEPQRFCRRKGEATNTHQADK